MHTKKKPLHGPSALTLPQDLTHQWRQRVVSHGKKSLKAFQKDPDSGSLPITQQTLELTRKHKRPIEDLWLIFNRDRQDLVKHYLTSEKAAFHYLLGFHLPNAARAYGTLLRLEERHPQIVSYLKSLEDSPMTASTKSKPANQSQKHPKTEEPASKEIRPSDDIKRPVYWSDYGCGTGAMAQAAAYWLRRHLKKNPLHVDLTDLGKHLLTCAHDLIASDPKLQPAVVTTRRFGLEALHVGRDRGDLRPAPASREDAGVKPFYGISLGYVWNELSRNPKARSKILELLNYHQEQGHETLVLIVEPATEHQAKAAMSWRDQLTQLGYYPLYPCPTGRGACPMTAPGRDWCFGEFIWKEPVECRQLDSLLGSDRKHLATSSYVFASPELWKKLQQGAPEPKKIVVGRPTFKRDLKKPSPKPESAGSPALTFEYLLCDGKSLSKAPAQSLGSAELKNPAGRPGEKTAKGQTRGPLKSPRNLPPHGNTKQPASSSVGEPPRSNESAGILPYQLRGTTFEKNP